MGRGEGIDPMLMEILRRTPPWVFVLFFVLLGLGLSQCRDRKVARPLAFPLPLAMVALSAYGVATAFPGSLMALAAWAAAVAMVVLLNYGVGYPRGVVYHPATATFYIPGSALPLILMMTIFCAKYGEAVALALRPEWHTQSGFLIGVGLVYGLLSGCFLAAAQTLWRKSRSRPRLDQQSPGGDCRDQDFD